MGSYCDLRISRYSVIEQKYRIDPELLSIFVEADKLHALHAPDVPASGEEDEEDGGFDGYCNTADAIAARLDLMGFTPAAARADFDLTRERTVQGKQDLNEAWTQSDQISATLRADNENEIDFLSRFTFDVLGQRHQATQGESRTVEGV